MSGSAGSRRRSGGAGRISRSDRMVSGRRWGSRGRGSLIRHFQSLRMRRRRGAGRRRGRILQSVRIAGMGCGSAGIDVRRVIRCWSSRCRRMRCAAEGAGELCEPLLPALELLRCGGAVVAPEHPEHLAEGYTGELIALALEGVQNPPR